MPFLTKGNIIDIGTGNGGLEKVLIEEGYEIKGIDIKNKSLFNAVVPTVYDGKTFPFANDAFDMSLFITVLHHTPNPEKLIEEAKRCSQKMIIVEDIYRNTFQKYLTFFTDSLVNLEFKGHPHTNKTDEEWKAFFKKMNLKLTYCQQYRFLFFFRQVIYVLEKWLLV